jgi:hypothetical protein
MKKRFVIEAIAIAILVTCLLVIWINLTIKEKEVYIKGHVPYEEFGIETSSDIYVDNMLKRPYTKSGRLVKYKGEE